MSLYDNKVYRLLKKVYYKGLTTVYKKSGVPYTISGFRFRMPVSCFKFAPYRYFPKDYERENFDFYRSVSKKGITCIDIGAHIGLYAVFMSKHANAKVYSFEPTRISQQVFQDTIQVNGCSDKVQLIPKAVSGSSGKTFFNVNEDPLCVANSLVVKSDDQKGYEVEIISVDEFIQSNGLHVDFIKIDAEGVELEVLRGARHTFLRDKPSGILGLHPFAFEDKRASYSSIWDLLEEYQLNVFYDNKPISRDEFMKAFSDKNEVFDLQFTGN